MPGTNAGTGQPITARCGKCRKSSSFYRDAERRGYRLEATGRTKKRRHLGGIRTTNRCIEIKCLDCGHVGWTVHIDAELLLSAQQKEAACAAKSKS